MLINYNILFLLYYKKKLFLESLNFSEVLEIVDYTYLTEYNILAVIDIFGNLYFFKIKHSHEKITPIHYIK